MNPIVLGFTIGKVCSLLLRVRSGSFNN